MHTYKRNHAYSKERTLASPSVLTTLPKPEHLFAADDIKALDAEPSPAAIKQAMAECAKLYRGVGFAFAGAHDEINNRAYAAGEAKLAEALSLAQQCNVAFAKAGVPLQQPLAQLTSSSPS
uniref:Pectinesterase inhibitor domain-containing protein n=1 Tax=Oryza brachyantha TaxID=4533 RepID=J3LIY0_ORYBR